MTQTPLPIPGDGIGIGTGIEPPLSRSAAQQFGRYAVEYIGAPVPSRLVKKSAARFFCNQNVPMRRV